MRRVLTVCLTLFVIATASAETVTIDLTAAKDNFGRSNGRTRNSGGSEFLLVARDSSVRTIVGFDLSSVSNKILKAEFAISMGNTMPVPLDLTIAPMVHTAGNASWREGLGSLGARGQNARLGESTFQWRAFRDNPWEDAKEQPAVNMMDAKLWEKPVARLSSVPWIDGNWIEVAVEDVALLDKIRLSEDKIVTFGLWGEKGEGTYFLCSRQSARAPRLTLEVEAPEEESE